MWNKATLVFVCVLLGLLGTCVAKDCDEYTDCRSCADARQTYLWFFDFKCYWCPFDKECHVYGSLVNPCISQVNIDTSKNCLNYDKGSYDPNKAYRYLQLSAAAYIGEPQACMDALAPDGDFVVKAVIVEQCDEYLFDYKECVAIVGLSRAFKEIVVAFRGTSSTKQLVDQAVVSLFTSRHSFKIGGEVQDYFANVYDDMYPCVVGSVTSLLRDNPGYKVIVTGHSLGGAIASLTAAALVYDSHVSKDMLELYTFGQPRVGDKVFAYKHDVLVKNSWRVVHSRDIVPHIPFCNLLFGCNSPYNMPFHHKTEVYYPQTYMSTSSVYRLCADNEDDSCSNGAVGDDPCIPLDLNECINFHTHYFRLDVGSACTNAMPGRKISRVWRNVQLSSIECKTIPQ